MGFPQYIPHREPTCPAKVQYLLHPLENWQAFRPFPRSGPTDHPPSPQSDTAESPPLLHSGIADLPPSATIECGSSSLRHNRDGRTSLHHNRDSRPSLHHNRVRQNRPFCCIRVWQTCRPMPQSGQQTIPSPQSDTTAHPFTTIGCGSSSLRHNRDSRTSLRHNRDSRTSLRHNRVRQTIPSPQSGQQLIPMPQSGVWGTAKLVPQSGEGGEAPLSTPPSPRWGEGGWGGEGTPLIYDTHYSSRSDTPCTPAPSASPPPAHAGTSSPTSKAAGMPPS